MEGEAESTGTPGAPWQGGGTCSPSSHALVALKLPELAEQPVGIVSEPQVGDFQTPFCPPRPPPLLPPGAILPAFLLLAPRPTLPSHFAGPTSPSWGWGRGSP